jgi:5-methylcytosine-specific restriction endonuclease McrA
MKQPRACECGCGEIVTCRPGRSPGPFRRGHDKSPTYPKQVRPVSLCECGCGEALPGIVKAGIRHGRQRYAKAISRVISGHDNRRSSPFTTAKYPAVEEARENERRLAREQYTPERRHAKWLRLHTTDLYRARDADAQLARRARKRGAFVEKVDRQVVWIRDKGICYLCQQPADPDNWNLEHIIPLGPGPHSYTNVAVAHPTCNQRKATMDRVVLAAWKMGLSPVPR